MNEAFAALPRIFSIDTVIYIAILLMTVYALIRCLLPISSASRRLRRGARTIITEAKQKKERQSWRDIKFLGDRLEGVWTDFLQNAEMREAHGEGCDVSAFVNEETIWDTVGNLSLAEITPGILTSLGILGTFLGLVRGLSGLRLDAADTQALLAAMQQLIGGMSTAFLTSIAGVSASLLFNLLNNRQMTRCRSALDRFCEVFSLYAMPKPVSEETAMLTMQQEQTAYLRKAAEEIGEKMTREMESAIMRAMLPVQRSMDNFIIGATQAQVQGVDQIVQLFLRRMNTALGGEMEQFRQSLAENGAAQQQAVRETQAAMQAVSEMSRDVINMQQMTQGMLEHFKSYVTDMSQSRAVTEEQQRRTVESLAQLEAQMVRQRDMIDHMAALQSNLESFSRQYAETTHAFLQEAGRQTDKVCRDMNKAADGLRDGAAALTVAGQTLSGSGARAVERAAERLKEGAELLRSADEKMKSDGE